MIYILCAVLLNPLVCTITTAAKAKSVNLNLETVLEFDKKNLDKDVQIIDNVQTFLHKVRRVLDKSKDYRRSYNKDSIKFTDFLENVLGLLVTFSDDELEELAVVIDEELRKYHYKGCKFYELVENQKLRDYIGDVLEAMRQTPARKMRKLLKRYLNKLQSRDFNKKDEDFANYVNSLYRGGAKENMHNVYKRFEDFSKTARRAHSEMVQVVRNAIRTIIFDHYSNLNVNARKDFRLKLDNFFIRYSAEDDRVQRAHENSDSEDNDNTKSKKGKKEKKKASRNIMNTDATVKSKHSLNKNQQESIASIFDDVKLIITTTKKIKRKRQKAAREKAANTDVDSLKYKKKSEEDKDDKKDSKSQNRDYMDIIDDIKNESIKQKERKLARDKTSSKDVALKHKQSSEEDRDGKKGHQSRDIDIKGEIKKKSKERKLARDKASSTDVALRHKPSSDEVRDGYKDHKSRDIDIIGEVKKKSKERKLARDKISNIDVTLKQKLSSEEDRHGKKGYKSRDIDIIDEIKKKSKERKLTRYKTSTTNVALKHKLPSEEDIDSKSDHKSHDIDNIDKIEKKSIKRKESKIARDKTLVGDVPLKHQLSSEEDRDGKKGQKTRDNTKMKPIKRERKLTPEEKYPDNLNKERSEKGNHGNKEFKLSDIEVSDVTTSKHTKRKRHKSAHGKSTPKEVTPERKYSSEESKEEKKRSVLHSDDENLKTSSSESSTVTVSQNPYMLQPVRNLDEEKKRMPLRFLSLFPETIPTTTEMLQPKKDKKLKKHKRGKAFRMRAESMEDPWQSSEPKKEKHRQRKVNKPETKMVVTEDRPLQEILTEHNAIIKAEHSQPPYPAEKYNERNKENRKRKHGRNSKPRDRSPKTSKLHETPQMFEMSPVSSDSDSEKISPLRKQFSDNGLAIESFENNVLDGHFLYRKQNYKDTFSKRSDLRKKAKQEREALSNRKKLETDDKKETTRKHKRKHKHHPQDTESINTDIKVLKKEDKPAFRAEEAEDTVDIKTTTSSHVSDDYIINKIHNLEKQLENVISKMDDNADTDKSTSTVDTTNTHNDIQSTASLDHVFSSTIVNKDRIYDNIETTPEIVSITVASSSSSESDNETVFEPKVRNYSNEKVVSNTAVFNANNTVRTSTTASIITAPVVKSDDNKTSTNSTSSKSFFKSTTTLKSTTSSTTEDPDIFNLIKKSLEVNEDLHDKKNETIAKNAKSSEEKDKASSKEVRINDKTSTKNDGRKVNKAVTLLPLNKFKTIDLILKVKTKTTSFDAISTNKEIQNNNNATKIKITHTQTLKVTATKATSPTSDNESKLNTTLPIASKLRTDSNITKNTNLVGKDKTTENNATVTSENITISSPTTVTVSVRSNDVSHHDNNTKVTAKGRRKLNYMIPENTDSPFSMKEGDWEKNRESSDLLYNWA